MSIWIWTLLLKLVERSSICIPSLPSLMQYYIWPFQSVDLVFIDFVDEGAQLLKLLLSASTYLKWYRKILTGWFHGIKQLNKPDVPGTSSRTSLNAGIFLGCQYINSDMNAKNLVKSSIRNKVQSREIITRAFIDNRTSSNFQKRSTFFWTCPVPCIDNSSSTFGTL